MFKKTLFVFVSIVFMSFIISCAEGVTATEAKLPPIAIPLNIGAIEKPTFADDALQATAPSSDAIISFADTLISATSDNVLIEDKKVTLTQAGVYELTGTATNAQIYIKTSNDEVVTLVLNNISLASNTGSIVYVENAKKVILYALQDTTSTLTDTATTEYEKNAVVFSRDDLSVSGGGALTIQAGVQKGIDVNDNLALVNTTLKITSASYGIKVNNTIKITQANVTINAGKDGIRSDNDVDANQSKISIESGTFDITAYGDGISSAYDITIFDGEFKIISGQDNSDITQTSAKGIKATNQMILTKGVFDIVSEDDALHANRSLLIYGGSYKISSNDDGIHADELVIVYDGDIDIAKSYEGIEALSIKILGGNIAIVASDDGINGAGGNDGSANWDFGGANHDHNGTDRPPFGDFNGTDRPPFGEFNDTNRPPFGDFDPADFNITGMPTPPTGGGDGATLEIAGGLIYVNARGDGLDVNGDLVLSGGTVVVSGPNESMNGALDYDSSFSVTGGTLVATGSSGMAQNASTATQGSVLIGLTASTTELLQLQDVSGNNIITFHPSKTYQSIVITSPLLQIGQTYNLYLGGEVTNYSSDFHGYYTDAVVNGGVLDMSIELSQMITSVGEIGRRGPRR